MLEGYWMEPTSLRLDLSRIVPVKESEVMRYYLRNLAGHFFNDNKSSWTIKPVRHYKTIGEALNDLYVNRLNSLNVRVVYQVGQLGYKLAQATENGPFLIRRGQAFLSVYSTVGVCQYKEDSSLAREFSTLADAAVFLYQAFIKDAEIVVRSKVEFVEA